MSSNFKAELRRAIKAGVCYLLEHQQADGYWVDWELPPGQSRMWTTAYVGWKLGGLPRDLQHETIAARQRAVAWLLLSELPGHGWGYTEAVGADADSTAHAILFLSGEGVRLPEGSYVRLEAFQSEDSGFSTYQRGDGDGSWCVSHPDVTPIALLALLTREHASSENVAISRGIDYIIRQRAESGLWNSFWWNTPLYGTYSCLALLDTLGQLKSDDKSREGLENLLPLAPANAFEIALLLSALMHLRAGIEATRVEADVRSKAATLATRLIETQRPDGSWNTVPILRVTRRDCYEPWKDTDAGPLYADQNRIFTSASVVDALARFWRITV